MAIGDHFYSIANSVDPSGFNALRPILDHYDIMNLHEMRHDVRGLKSNKAEGIDGIPSELYNLHLTVF